MGCVDITADIPQAIASGGVNKNILFEGNTISRTPGLALFVSSAAGISVSNNVIMNSNTLGAFPPWYGSAIGVTAHGSIMVTKASNVTVTGNRQIISAELVEKGIYVDPANTTNITVQDNVGPVAGRASGGQTIPLIGEFAGLSTVTIGGTPVSWSYTIGTSVIAFTTPPHAVGAVDIVLTPTAGSPITRTNAFATCRRSSPTIR